MMLRMIEQHIIRGILCTMVESVHICVVLLYTYIIMYVHIFWISISIYNRRFSSGVNYLKLN